MAEPFDSIAVLGTDGMLGTEVALALCNAGFRVQRYSLPVSILHKSATWTTLCKTPDAS